MSRLIRTSGRARPQGAVSFTVTRGGITTPAHDSPLQRFAAFLRRFPWR